jgi:hypothetical protein
MGRRPRTIDVYFDLGENPPPVDGSRMSRSGEVSLLFRGQPVRVQTSRVEVSYERPKGAKVLQRVFLDPAAPTADAQWSLRRYDRLYAIDTNTRRVAGGCITATAVVECWFQPLDSQHEVAEIVSVLAFTFDDEAESPERVGWRETITRIQNAPWYTSDLRVGLIVDSELDELPAYNTRQRPILGDFFLPPSFELNYASPEVAREGLANFMLARCNREANSILARLKRSPS